jgi:uncharacterized protein (TIGR03083 family)
MSQWNGMTYEAKDNMLRVVREQAEGMFALAEPKDVWTMPTNSTDWQVRDVIGHIVDVTEGYFVGFDAARAEQEGPESHGLPIMAKRLDEHAQEFRELSQQEMLDRLKTDFEKMMGIFDGLSEEDWSGLIVNHGYMGPLPSFFYPAFHLMDYGVHSWDIRQGLGKEHALDGETADLLVPFMFVLWQSTAQTDFEDTFKVGIRILSGENAGDTVLTVSPDGMAAEPGSVDGLPVLYEFDPGSFVLTAFGRANAGTFRGSRDLSDRFLRLFLRI